MITDLGEQSLPIQEQRSPSGYIHLVRATDTPESHFFEGDHRIKFPKKRIASVGNVDILLIKDTKPHPNTFYLPEFYLSSNGIERISHEEAQKRGLYNLILLIENPVAGYREGDFFAHVSLDGQTDIAVCRFINESELEKEQGRLWHDPPIEQGTILIDNGWKQAEAEAFIAPSVLNISFYLENRQFLENLFFSFSSTHPLQGEVK